MLITGLNDQGHKSEQTKTPKQPALTPDKLSTSRVSNFLEPHHTEMLICAKCSNFSRNAIKTKIHTFVPKSPKYHFLLENLQFDN